MPYLKQSSPHVSAREGAWSMYIDALLALLPLAGMAVYYYGLRALVLCLLSPAVCWAADFLCTLASRRKVNLADFSPLITGLIIALMLPATVPYWLLAVADLFAILLIKQAFGGLGSNLFNPAAGGLAFVTVCFPETVTAYVAPFTYPALLGETAAATAESPAMILAYGGIPSLSFSDVLLGSYPGPMGTGNLMVVVACLLFLAVRRTVNFRIPLSFTVAAVLVAWIFPRSEEITRLNSVLFEVAAGAVLFAGLLMFADPVTAPRSNAAKWFYGALGGVLVMIFRFHSPYVLSEPFALLLMNALSGIMDRLILNIRYGFGKSDSPINRSRIKGYHLPVNPVKEKNGEADS